MKVLSKTLWAIDVNNSYTMSIEKMKNVANEFGNDIILLTVLSRNLKQTSFGKKVENHVLTRLNEIKEKLSDSDKYNIEVRTVYGNIADCILKASEEEDVNVIILNKGNKGILGKHGLNVFRKSKKPISIISEIKQENEKHIVCPVDNSVESAVALKSAILHARKTDSILSVVSVFEPVSLSSPRLIRMGVDVQKENRYHYWNFKKELNEFLKDFDFSGLDMHLEILKGSPDIEIARYSKRASLLYVGSSGKSGLIRTFRGSVSENVIHKVNCAVVTVKTEEVFKLRIPSKLLDTDKYYKRGKELIKLGFVKEAILQFKAGLKINDLHLPSMLALSKAFHKLGNKEKSAYYKDLAKTIKNSMINRKIEEEIRKNFRTIG